MQTNELIKTLNHSPLCTSIVAKPFSLWQENFPLHLPHALPGPLLSESRVESHEDSYHPRMAIAIAFGLDGLQDQARFEVLGANGDASHPFHTLYLPFSIEVGTFETRIAVLQELSDLLLWLANRDREATILAISHSTSIYRMTVYRHVPVGIFDPESGRALWIHPSADAFDLLRHPFPESQQFRVLGPSNLFVGIEDCCVAPEFDPATGLPGWANKLKYGLTPEPPESPASLNEVVEVVAQSLWADGGADSVEQGRKFAMEAIRNAQADMFRVRDIGNSDDWPD